MPLRVDFDRDLWLYIPTEWPWMGYPTLENWRDAVVAALADAYGYDAATRDWLSATLEGMVRGAGEGEERFAYLGRPHESIGMVSLYEWATLAESSLDDLLGVTDGASVRPPVVSPIEGAGLGPGTKAVRFTTEAAPEASSAPAVVGVAHWVWRLPDRDVILIAGDSDLVRFDERQPAFDDLARSISLVSDDSQSAREEGNTR
ncbi:hypothetical protein [Microbacterium lacus]|uniref:hypothetical protein n=1 Tax=Microbacterium lacus TaxID=415217 RepID=UPI000C2BB8E3|nr:hypothetical protein [Microbacterium lacus]